MKEILGGNGLNKTFENIGISAINTYKNEHYEVWELTEEDFEVLCDIPDDQWEDDWGWWRYAEGSNLGKVNEIFTINGLKIKAWRNEARLDDLKSEWKEIDKDDRVDYGSRAEFIAESCQSDYYNLLEYFCEEIGCSTEKNICALAVDLAKQNNMTMAELFNKYN